MLVSSSGDTGRIAQSADVVLTNPTNGDVLYYDAVVGKWKNHHLTATDVGALTTAMADGLYAQPDSNGQIPLTILQAIIDPATGKVRPSLLP